MPAGLATRSCDQVPLQFFCTINFLVENRSFVDFEIGNESVGGDLEENCQLRSIKEMRCAFPFWKMSLFSLFKSFSKSTSELVSNLTVAPSIPRILSVVAFFFFADSKILPLPRPVVQRNPLHL